MPVTIVIKSTFIFMTQPPYAGNSERVASSPLLTIAASLPHKNYIKHNNKERELHKCAKLARKIYCFFPSNDGYKSLFTNCTIHRKIIHKKLLTQTDYKNHDICT